MWSEISGQLWVYLQGQWAIECEPSAGAKFTARLRCSGIPLGDLCSATWLEYSQTYWYTWVHDDTESNTMDKFIYWHRYYVGDMAYSIFISLCFVVFCCGLVMKDFTLEWRHNEHDGISKHQPHECLLNHLFTHRSKKTSKLQITGLCEGNSPVTGEFPAQRASNMENVSIWWRHHDSYFLLNQPVQLMNPWWIWVNEWHESAKNFNSLALGRYGCHLE